jgi:hypothetical protein
VATDVTSSATAAQARIRLPMINRRRVVAILTTATVQMWRHRSVRCALPGVDWMLPAWRTRQWQLGRAWGLLARTGVTLTPVKWLAGEQSLACAAELPLLIVKTAARYCRRACYLTNLSLSLSYLFGELGRCLIVTTWSCHCCILSGSIKLPYWQFCNFAIAHRFDSWPVSHILDPIVCAQLACLIVVV